MQDLTCLVSNDASLLTLPRTLHICSNHVQGALLLAANGHLVFDQGISHQHKFVIMTYGYLEDNKYLNVHVIIATQAI